MSKARDLADFVSDGSPLADGTISVSEVSGAAPTASPTFTGTVTASALTVAASTSLVKLEDTDTNAYAQIATDGSGIVNIAADEGNTGTSPRITFDVSTTERMRIDSSGNVGIGTTNPTKSLTISSSTPAIRLEDTDQSVEVELTNFEGDGILTTNGASNIKLQTNNLERLRITPSGEFGIGGANYGTAGQVLTSGGSGAAPTWADASGGGGTIEATASGAIANGDLVSLNSDGTVSVTSGFGLSAVSYSSSNSESNSSCYDTLNDKVVVAYRDTSDNYGKAVVGTVSGTSISFGTPVTFAAVNAENINVTFDSTNNKVVCIYRNATSGNEPTAIVGTVSGTSISFGTAVQASSANSRFTNIAFDSNAGKVVVTYRDVDNSNYGTAVVGTVSGTSISFGTPVVLLSATFSANMPVFDSNSNKMVVLYKGDIGDGKAKVGTVSGTSISFGTEGQFDGGQVEDVVGTFDSTNNKVIVVYHNSSGIGKAAVGTVSGTSISFGGAPTFSGTNSIDLPFAAYDPLSEEVGVVYKDNTNSSKATYVGLTVSGTTLSASDPVVIGDFSSHYNRLLYDPDAEAFIHTGRNATATDAVGQVYKIDANINNWVGFATEAVSDTNDSTFTVVGGINESQSSLTVGAKYYISDSGALTTTVNEGYEVGKALSATKMLVTYGSVG